MAFTSQFFTTTSTTSTYTLAEPITAVADILVIVNGLVLIPGVDYSIASTNIIFNDIPSVGSDVEIRFFNTSSFRGSVGFGGSAGRAGYVGSSGDTGTPGYTGSRGSDGSLGYTGSIGIGYIGSKGDPGDPVGYTGSAGAGIPTTNQLIVSTGATSYTLTRSVSNPLHILVIVNGLVYTPVADYSVVSTELIFAAGSVPDSSSDIEVRYFTNVAPVGFQGSSGFRGSRGLDGYNGSIGLSGGIGYTGSRGAGFTGSTGAVGAPDYSQKIVCNGTDTYTMDRYVSAETHIILSVNGLVQIPVTDYTVADYTLIFAASSIPPTGSDIEIRFFNIADKIGYSGSDGSTGYFGSKGYQGSAGFKGSVGLNGIAEVYVSNTVPPGPFEKGELWWDNEDGILSIYYNDELTWVSVGDSIRGPIGYNGCLGYTGSFGVGYTGSASEIIGYTGSFGYTGCIGYTGSQGDIGYTGSASEVVGYTGSFGVGYTGSLGDTGYTGSASEIIGYTGSKGDIGYTGSASEVVGYTGSLGIGYTGSQGNTGFIGSRGDLGYVGSIGQSGTPVFLVDENVTSVSASGLSLVDVNCQFSRVFNITGYTGAYLTVNLINAGLGSNKVTNVVLILNQASNALIPSIRLDGISTTLIWQAGSVPSVVGGKTDFLSLSIVKISNTTRVFAQLVSFG